MCKSIVTAAGRLLRIVPMGQTAVAVANYLLSLSSAEGIDLTPMKLQKLVYIAHGWHLALRGDPLVTDEYAEAWDYGPVFPSVYYEFRRFGRNPVDGPAADVVLFDDGSTEFITPTIEDAEPLTREVVDRVWQVYKEFDGLQLSDMTHATGTPWYETRLRAKGFRNTAIPNDLIEDHYSELARRNREQKAAEDA